MYSIIRKLKVVLVGLCVLAYAQPAFSISEEDISLQKRNKRKKSAQYEGAPATAQPASTDAQNTYTQKLMAGHDKGSSKSICNSWKPTFKKNKEFQTTPQYFLSMNTGVGFLYFDGVSGGNARLTDTTNLKTKKPQNRFIYNRTPLTEALIGWNPLSFMGLALSLQHQGGVFVQRYNIDRTRGTSPDLRVFEANVALNSVAAKLYFTSPVSMIWKTIAYTGYLAVAVGPSWQTWSQIQLVDITTGFTQPMRQKISANCFIGGEAGLKLRSLIPNLNLSIILGTKFNLWGQARTMGNRKNQYKAATASANSTRWAFNQPWSVRTVYQWAPFIGFSLAF